MDVPFCELCTDKRTTTQRAFVLCPSSQPGSTPRLRRRLCRLVLKNFFLLRAGLWKRCRTLETTTLTSFQLVSILKKKTKQQDSYQELLTIELIPIFKLHIAAGSLISSTNHKPIIIVIVCRHCLVILYEWNQLLIGNTTSGTMVDLNTIRPKTSGSR